MPSITIVEPSLPETNRMVMAYLDRWYARQRAIVAARMRLGLPDNDKRGP